MNKIRKILDILRNDKKPLYILLGKLIMRFPWDVTKFFRITIRIQDYFIYLSQSAIAVAFLRNPNDRISDYMLITSYLKKNDIYIDVGANIGTTLIPAAKSINGGKAIAFEPHPKIFKYLAKNVLLNSLVNSVELHNCALGNERGYLDFSSGRNDDTNRVMLSAKGIKVPVKLLDDIGEKYSKINLIKIDVEGYEKFVIEGGIKTLEKTECIYIEVSEEQYSWYQYSMKELLITLEKLGFYLFLLKESESLESINYELNLSKNQTVNVIGIKNIADFKIRTGWRIDDDFKA